MTSRLRELIQQLGEAIHESVIESEQIAGVVATIREHGFDVLLMLEATIGLNEVTGKEDDDAAPTLRPALPALVAHLRRGRRRGRSRQRYGVGRIQALDESMSWILWAIGAY